MFNRRSVFKTLFVVSASIVFAIVAAASGTTEAMLLSCMDYRLVDDTERYMASRGLRDKYDHVIIAGASLGAVTKKYPAWNQTFWEHLDIAITLHHVHTVIILDHRDCGAYKVILEKDFAKEPSEEAKAHTGNLKELRKQIAKKYPKMKVEMLLMGLDGVVEEIE